VACAAKARVGLDVGGAGEGAKQAEHAKQAGNELCWTQLAHGILDATVVASGALVHAPDMRAWAALCVAFCATYKRRLRRRTAGSARAQACACEDRDRDGDGDRDGDETRMEEDARVPERTNPAFVDAFYWTLAHAARAARKPGCAAAEKT